MGMGNTPVNKKLPTAVGHPHSLRIGNRPNRKTFSLFFNIQGVETQPF
jgi:hypothetical protein